LNEVSNQTPTADKSKFIAWPTDFYAYLTPHSAPQNDCFVELFRARIGENETGTRQKSLHKLDMRPPQV
jgi:hypothetical protein